ncbi:39S ribosomal protein L34, mitochondrial isoform X1 [Sturnira hondurensis]|uniref:39S ribosomal protein L34, mitochondrial isoform X1 n=1 Tax=Sturnira hondurensis TaxID=192404 RepID=UPI00187A4534|nr:39S ribosomal protein L34, mitochondrial isoform X1 [Sturnira hondurensis]
MPFYVTGPQEKLHYPVGTADHVFSTQEVELQLPELSVPQLRSLWLQPQALLRLPDVWGLPGAQPSRGKARGNEYQPSNIKRKHKHGWIKRLSTPAGVQVILRRMLKGRKSLSH